jgi:maleate cis-trans isomerase
MNYMQEHYGPDVLTELHTLRMGLHKVTDEELKLMLNQYRTL